MADGNNATPLSKILEGEAMTRLAQAISQLPPFQQEAVRLRYIEGYKLALIGERMGRSDPAIAGLLKRALRKLRILLAEGDHA